MLSLACINKTNLKLTTMTNHLHTWLYKRYQETKNLVKFYQEVLKVTKQKLAKASQSEDPKSCIELRNYYLDQLAHHQEKLKKQASIAKYLKQEIRKHSK